jgi:hypothetical protein
VSLEILRPENLDILQLSLEIQLILVFLVILDCPEIQFLDNLENL